MKDSHLYVAAVSLLLANLLLVNGSNAQISSNAPPLPDSYVVGMGATNEIEAQNISNRMVYLNQFTNSNDTLAAYHGGLITKGEAIWIQLQQENATPQNIYGKVIDQDGNPIPGVDVTGSIAHRQGFYADDKWTEYKTQTDANGLFEFTGLRGADWAVDVKKEGYEMDYNKGWSGPRGGPHGTQSDPNNRAILTMWKLQGAEHLEHVVIQAGLACDGTPRSFDLLTGQRLSSGGDMTATLIRNPVHIDRKKHFDWTLTLNIPSGGFVDYQGGYENEAPESGYRSIYTINMPANTNNWTSSFRHTLFFKSRNGQNYGVMTIDLMANYEPPPTHFEIDAFVNPAGSRDLEFDPKKVKIVRK